MNLTVNKTPMGLEKSRNNVFVIFYIDLLVLEEKSNFPEFKAKNNQFKIIAFQISIAS